MAKGLRIKGQEVEVRITSAGALLATLTAIRSATVEAMTEILTENYLGETTSRKDEIFNGTRGRLEFHLEDGAAFDLVEQVLDRAQRREPGVVVNIAMTATFPDGSKKRVLVSDVSFGPLPVGFPSRRDYVTFTIDYETGERPQILDV